MSSERDSRRARCRGAQLRSGNQKESQAQEQGIHPCVRCEALPSKTAVASDLRGVDERGDDADVRRAIMHENKASVIELRYRKCATNDRSPRAGVGLKDFGVACVNQHQHTLEKAGYGTHPLQKQFLRLWRPRSRRRRREEGRHCIHPDKSAGQEGDRTGDASRSDTPLSEGSSPPLEGSGQEEEGGKRKATLPPLVKSNIKVDAKHDGIYGVSGLESRRHRDAECCW
ncbi:hypothetical protein DFH09DRAFT_1099769 [Mycena vulgaris]|nr:hypothetical protein DFH09DRAFT_1099769 [Mycena vulgaris]